MPPSTVPTKLNNVEGLGEHAAQDVDEGEETGDVGARVADGDAHDVRGEPEIGVEHGTHHFHGVAFQCEVMRDDEGDETDDGRDDEADAVLVEFFQNQTKQHRAPADKDGGGIKIRHGRPAFQHHAINEADGVDDKRQPYEPHGGAAQRFGQIEPRENGE